MIALVCMALAGSVGGFSTPGGERGHSAAIQLAALFDEDRAYGQATLLMSTHWRNLGVDVEINGLAGTGTTNWEDAGLGTLRVGVRAFFGGPGLRQAIGVDYRAALPGPAVSFWVVHAAEAFVIANPRLTWDLTMGPGDAPFSLRVTVGYSPGSFGAPNPGVIVGAGTGVAATKLLPLSPSWALLFEAEAIFDETPFSVRAGGRWAHGDRWSVDALVSVPLVLFFEHPVLVPAIQVRGAL